MFSNRLTFAALVVGCLTAAGAGGYLASRQNTVPTPAAAAEPSPSVPGTASIDRPVEETEAVIGDSPSGTRDASKTERVTSSAVASPAPKASTRSTSARRRPHRAQASPVPPASSRTAGTSTSAPPSTASSASPVAAAEPSASAPASDDRAPVESTRAAEPPATVYEELVVSSNSVIGLQTETKLSSETARIEDQVEARVSRDVKVGDAIAIPAGSRAIGSVIQIERGGKFKERARLGIRFTALVLADGTRLPMNTETIYRDGEAPGNSSAAKIGGGAIGGAIPGCDSRRRKRCGDWRNSRRRRRSHRCSTRRSQ